MPRLVGSRELNQYENDPTCAVGVYATPLTTKWDVTSPCRMMQVEPGDLSGVVLDIGSGDDVLGFELHRAGADVEMHRVNPALGPDAPIEIQFAMREAIYMRASKMGIDPSVTKPWGLSHGVFPDISGLPQADHVVSLYCFPTITFDCHAGGIRQLRRDLNQGFEAISAVSKPDANIFVGPIELGEPLVEVKRAVAHQKELREKTLSLRHGAGQVLLRLY